MLTAEEVDKIVEAFRWGTNYTQAKRLGDEIHELRADNAWLRQGQVGSRVLLKFLKEDREQLHGLLKRLEKSTRMDAVAVESVFLLRKQVVVALEEHDQECAIASEVERVFAK